MNTLSFFARLDVNPKVTLPFCAVLALVMILLPIASAQAQDARESLVRVEDDNPYDDRKPTTKNRPKGPVGDGEVELLQGEKFKPFDAIDRMDDPKNGYVQLRNFRDCQKTERQSAEKSSRAIDYGTACRDQIEVLEAQLTTEQVARAREVEASNRSRREAQELESQRVRERIRTDTRRESDVPRGSNQELRLMTLLSLCEDEAEQTREFTKAECPTRLRLTEEDLIAISETQAKLNERMELASEQLEPLEGRR